MKVVLIGQAPSRKGNPSRPLERLSAKIAELSGLNHGEYAAVFEPRNLLKSYPGKKGKGDAFPIYLARNAASKLKTEIYGKQVLMLGGNVARAFAFGAERPLEWAPFNGGRAAILPHPSGINRWYNSAKNRRKAKQFLESLCRS